MIIEIKENSGIIRRLPTNYLTEASSQNIRPGRQIPISISKRKLGDINMREIMSKISINHLYNLERVSTHLINGIIGFIEDNSYPWTIEIPK